MLISWSRDGRGNTTWRIWGIKVTVARICALVLIGIAASGVGALTKHDAPTVSGSSYSQTYISPGCTAAYPVAHGDGYCYTR